MLTSLCCASEMTQYTDWNYGYVITPVTAVYVIFEAYKPGVDDRADIAIDDFRIALAPCPGFCETSISKDYIHCR